MICYTHNAFLMNESCCIMWSCVVFYAQGHDLPCSALPLLCSEISRVLCQDCKEGVHDDLLPYIVLHCPALCPAPPLPCPCPALPCPALPCPALPCPALPCPGLP